MNRSAILRHPAFILMCSMVLTVLLLTAFLPKTLSVSRVVESKKQEENAGRDVWLPHWGRGLNAPITYTLTVDYASHQTPFYQFMPFGCIEKIAVNGQQVGFPENRACNANRGFRVNLKDHLRPGENQIAVTLEANQNFGLNVMPNMMAKGLFSIPALLAFALFAQMIFGFDLLLRRYGADKFTRIVFAAGALMLGWQMYQTTYMEYVTDMPSHVQYVRYIANNWSIPPIDRGWQFYHPPFYYALGAIPFAIAKATQCIDPIAALRFFTLGCFLAGIVFGILSLRQVLQHSLGYKAACVLLCFWPAGIMLAARPESNLLYYTFYSMCVYLIIRWFDTRNPRLLLWMLLAGGLAVGARTNGLVVMGLAGIVFAWAMYRRQIQLTVADRALIYAAVFAVLFGFGVNYGRTYLFSQINDVDVDFIVGNIDQLNRSVTIEQSMLNFFKFDINAWLNQPYLNSGNDDAAGRQYFWNFFMKSSLYGQFQDWKNPQLAVGLSLLLLVLLAYALLGVIAMWIKKSNRRELKIQGLLIAVPLAAMALHRYNFPFAPSQDFRYVYPILISFGVLYGLSVNWIGARSKPGGRLGMLLAIVFAACSVAFYLGQRNHIVML